MLPGSLQFAAMRALIGVLCLPFWALELSTATESPVCLAAGGACFELRGELVNGAGVQWHARVPPCRWLPTCLMQHAQYVDVVSGAISGEDQCGEREKAEIVTKGELRDLPTWRLVRRPGLTQHIVSRSHTSSRSMLSEVVTLRWEEVMT